MKVLAIHLDAGRDTNGNPKRVFVLMDPKTGDIVRAVDEGYKGTGALDEAQKEGLVITMGPSFQTSNADYKELLRDFRG